MLGPYEKGVVEILYKESVTPLSPDLRLRSLPNDLSGSQTSYHPRVGGVLGLLGAKLFGRPGSLSTDTPEDDGSPNRVGDVSGLSLSL